MANGRVENSAELVQRDISARVRSRNGSVLITWVGALALLVPTTSCGGGSESGASTGLGALALGDIDREYEFFVTDGGGTITVVNDTSIGDIACAHTGSGNGQFVIRINPDYMDLVAPPIQDFFLAHEYGHIYLKHLGQINPNYREREHFADAYGVRILARDNYGTYVEQAIEYFEVSDSPPDDTHPSYEARAWYQREVFEAYGTDPSQVPEPPPTFGTLLLSNPEILTGGVHVNGLFVGDLGTGQADSLPVLGDPFWGDSYSIELRHPLTGVVLLSGEATVFAPGTTAWPSSLFSGNSEPDRSIPNGTGLGRIWDSFAPGPASSGAGWRAGALPSPVELLMSGNPQIGHCGAVSHHQPELLDRPN